MSNQQSIYVSLNFCNYEFNNKMPQKKKVLNDLGRATDTFLNIYLPANSAFVNAVDNKLYPTKNSFFNAPATTLGINYGVIAYIFKQAEGKDEQRAITEVTLETFATYVFAHKAVVNTATQIVTHATARFGIIMAGGMLGGYAGSVAPIVGTVVGAVLGACLAGKFEKWLYSDEDAQLEKNKAENKKIEELEKQYKLKIDRVVDYLVRNNYIELRQLDEIEAKELCEEASNLNKSYFGTIMLMQSFSDYLDRNKTDFKDDTEREKLNITSIKNAIPITIEVEKCYNGAVGYALRNTVVYVYNHRFKRIVAKAKSDSEGKLIIHNVYVSKERGIDKLSFINNRNNFSESNFNLSLSKYDSFTNVQVYHKNTKVLRLSQIYFNFNTSKRNLEHKHEVLHLQANINGSTVELIPAHNAEDTRLRYYIKYSYMVFDVTNNNIDRETNITIENRANSGLENPNNKITSQCKIREDWKDKIVVFFAYFDNQVKTPLCKISFMTDPLVIIDVGNSRAIPQQYKPIVMIFEVIQYLKEKVSSISLVQLQKNAEVNMSLKQRVQIANAIKRNTQSKKILFLSLHIDSESTGKASGMRCFYNDKAYKKEEEKFIEELKKISSNLNNDSFAHKGNMYVNKFVNMPSLLITLGFISNINDRNNLQDKSYRNMVADKLALAINNYMQE